MVDLDLESTNIYAGTTIGQPNTYTTSCGGNGREQIFKLTVPAYSFIQIGLVSSGCNFWTFFRSHPHCSHFS